MEQSSRLSLVNLSHAVVARWPIALAVAAVIFAVGVSQVLEIRYQYRAETVLLLEPPASELGSQAGDRSSTPVDPLFVRSESGVLASDGVSRAVIDVLDLRNVAEFQPGAPGWRSRAIEYVVGLFGKPPPPPQSDTKPLTQDEMLSEQVLGAYRPRLSVSNDDRSKIVRIGFQSSDARLAATIANAHAAVYLSEQARRRTEGQRVAIDWLKKEVDDRAKEVQLADKRVSEYQLGHGIVGSARDGTVVEQKLGRMNDQYVDARREMARNESLLTGIRNARKGGDPQTVATLLDSPAFTDLLRKRVETESQLAALGTRLAPGHPTYVKKRQELASINKTLNDQLVRIESEAQTNLASSRAQVESLAGDVRNETSQKISQDRVTAGLPGLVAEADVKRQVFQAVLNRYQTLLAERSLLAPTASIVSKAVPPSSPVYPNRKLLFLVAAMIAAFAGCLAAIIVDALRAPSMSLRRMADAVGIRPIAAIPHFQNSAARGGPVSITDPNLFIESIRSLRNAVMQFDRADSSLVCLVTSVLPGQGKTLVAMSLARALARSEGRVLFIEADLRKPSASHLARLPQPAVGIGALLRNEASLDAAVLRDETSGLDMLLAERDSVTAVELLTGEALRDLLGRLRKHYDVIILDSPPIGLVSDALTLSTVVDQTIMIARQNHITVPELQHGVRMLNEANHCVAGLVLTDVDPDSIAPVNRKVLHTYVVGITSRGPGEPAKRGRVRTIARKPRRAVNDAE